MSSTGDTSAVMRGVVEGARDFLIKPLRMEELKLLWQHVVRYTSELTKYDSSQPSTKDGNASKGSDNKSSKAPVWICPCHVF